MDLDNLVRQQAKVGLINARGRLRQQAGAPTDGQVDGVIQSNAQGFSPQQAERIESTLSQADNENLELVTRRVIQTQAAAEASVSQLQVTLPVYGQRLQFLSPLQVEPGADMAVTFSARSQHLARIDPSLWYGAAIFACLLASVWILHGVHRTWDRLDRALTPAAQPVPPTPSPEPSDAAKPDDPDQSNSRVSSEELL